MKINKLSCKWMRNRRYYMKLLTKLGCLIAEDRKYINEKYWSHIF